MNHNSAFDNAKKLIDLALSFPPDERTFAVQLAQTYLQQQEYQNLSANGGGIWNNALQQQEVA